MNNYYLTIFVPLLLLFFGGCSQINSSKRTTEAEYLSESKACFVGENPGQAARRKLSPDLQMKLKEIEPDDHIGNRLLKSGELLIHYQKYINGEVISIGFEIDLNREKGCERISVHEILS